MVKWLKKFLNPKDSSREAYLAEQELLDVPWANFEIDGFEADGRIKVQFHWNKAFINKLTEIGFQAETEEDSVQLFFYTAQLKPTEFSGDESVQSLEHPSLSGPQNTLKM